MKPPSKFKSIICLNDFNWKVEARWKKGEENPRGEISKTSGFNRKILTLELLKDKKGFNEGLQKVLEGEKTVIMELLGRFGVQFINLDIGIFGDEDEMCESISLDSDTLKLLVSLNIEVTISFYK